MDALVTVLPVPGGPWIRVSGLCYSTAFTANARKEAGRFLPQMRHCTRCRADAVGLLGEPTNSALTACLLESSRLPRRPEQERPYVAVATREGLLVNEHLGDAAELCIYRQCGSGYEIVAARRTPPPGGGAERWRRLAQTLNDCRAILVSNAGETPRAALEAAGIHVVEIVGVIEDALDAVYNGGDLRALARRAKRGCAPCAGRGTGCG